MLLYRPVGLHELRLIYESAMRAFPPRLPEQPIFYPVLTLAYARKIALEWNTKASSYAGYVLQFSIDDAYASKFAPQDAGGREHRELWVPAEELDEFNRHIQGDVLLVEAYFGDAFVGHVPADSGLKGKNATEQFLALERMVETGPGGLRAEVMANHAAVFLHFAFWSSHDVTRFGVGDEARGRALRAIEGAWAASHPERPLGLAAGVPEGEPGGS